MIWFSNDIFLRVRIQFGGLWRCAYVTWSSSSTHTQAIEYVYSFLVLTHIHASHSNQIESFLYLLLAIFEPVLLSAKFYPQNGCVCESVCVLGFMQISILIVAIVLRMSTCAHSIATACVSVCVWVSVCSLTHTYTHTHVYVWLNKHFSPPYTHTHT